MQFTVGGTGNHAAAGDALEVVAAADEVLELLGITITQEDLTSIEEVLVTISRIVGAFTSGSGGTSATPVKNETGQAASGITGELFNTTDLTGGTKEVIHRGMWNVVSEFLYKPIPKEMKKASPTDGYLVEIGTPSGATDIYVQMEYEQIGG